MNVHRPDACRNDHPAVRKRVTDLRRVQAGEHLKTIILSPWIQGYDTHWVDGHTEPCTQRVGECELHKAGKPYKWIGFLHVYVPVTRENFFLEMTDHAWEDAKRVKGEIPTFRGLGFTWFRKTGKINSAVTCIMWSDEPLPDARLIPPKDVEDSLRVAWKNFFRT